MFSTVASRQDEPGSSVKTEDKRAEEGLPLSEVRQIIYIRHIMGLLMRGSA